MDPMEEEGRQGMSFSPSGAPVCGGGNIVVKFEDDSMLVVDGKYYIVFEGINLRHVTTMKEISAFTFQGIIPDHDQEEEVQMSVYVSNDCGSHRLLARNGFKYVYDSAHFMAQFLIESVYDHCALDDLESIRAQHFDLSTEVLTTLDDRLTHAFEHLQTPEHWSILGDDVQEDELLPRETLLHFAARLGLKRFLVYLLDKPGSLPALRLPNKHGQFPVDLANASGLTEVVDIISTFEATGQIEREDSRSAEKSNKIKKHNFGTVTLSNKLSETTHSIEDDLIMLQHICQLTDGELEENGRKPKPLVLGEIHSDGSDDDSEEDNIKYRRGHSSLLYLSEVACGEKRHGRRHSDGYQISPPHSAPPMIYNSIACLQSYTGGFPNNSPEMKRKFLEENLYRLHDIREKLLQLQAENNQQVIIQHSRKDILSRFSSSCPTLTGRISSPPPHPDADHYKSMLNMVEKLDLKEQDDQEKLDADVTDIKIQVNDIVVDDDELTKDKPRCRSPDPEDEVSDGDLLTYQKVPRRRSWCTTTQETDSKGEKVKIKKHLKVTPRSMSLSSLEGQDDSVDSEEEEDDEEEEEDEDDSYQDICDTSPSAPVCEKTVAERAPTPFLCIMTKSDDENRRPSFGGEGTASTHGSSRSLGEVETSGEETDHDSVGVRKTNDLLAPPPSPLTKSASTPSILTSNEDNRERRPEAPVESHTFISQSEPSYIAIQKLVEDHDSQVSSNQGGYHDDDDDISNYLQQSLDTPSKHRLSLLDFLRESPALEIADDSMSHKKEKSRRNRGKKILALGSYRKIRQKKEELKRSTHQFVSVCYSNSTTCDVCGKSMANKPALQCENCLVNVHENSCKDQIIACTKFKHQRLTQKPSLSQPVQQNLFRERINKGGSLPLGLAPLALPEVPDHQAILVPSKPPQLVSSSVNAPKNASPPSTARQVYTPSGYSQWRRVATKLGVNRVINEETEEEDVTSNILNANSLSMESLDEGAAEINDFEDDPDLMLMGKEPETWSVTADKKLLKKMSAKDIKRQDIIYELILTEKHHCRTLKIMQKIFYSGMARELHMTPEVINRIFPKLDELIDLHITFLHRLRERQRQTLVVENVGDILTQQFEGETAERFKSAYGVFCSKHKEAVHLYKDILKNDRKFQNFIKKCSMNDLCKRQGIPECILLVTQRMTKYPLLMESMIKATKENKPDYKRVVEALSLIKNILSSIDTHIANYEKEQRLYEIYNKIDAKSTAIYKSKKWKKSDLLSNNRKLIHEGLISWRNARGKLTEVIAVILSDVLFFLQESNQKYSFISQDNKSCVISLHKLLVREKADRQDSKGIFLISSNPQDPEMYELVCQSSKEKKTWIEVIRNAVQNCPEDDEGVPSETEEERKIQEARSAKVRELIEYLHTKDMEISNICDEKMKIINEMLELVGGDSMELVKPPFSTGDNTEVNEAKELLLAAIQEASKLSSFVYGSGLSRSVSSVGEHESGIYMSPSLPKRAETFGGFDSSELDKGVLSKVSMLKKKSQPTIKEQDGRCSSLQSLTQESDSDSPQSSDPPLSTTSNKLKIPWRASTSALPIDSNRISVLQKEKHVGRRGSYGFLHGFRTQKMLEKEEQDKSPEHSSEKGSLGELSNCSSISSHALINPSKETANSAAQLTYYLNALLCYFTQQLTSSESTKAQLAEANEKLGKLTTESIKDSRDRKNLYRHNQQLEELRNLQEALTKERELWHKERDLEFKSLEEKRHELEKIQEQVRLESENFNRQRELFFHQCNMLQKQGIPFNPMTVISNTAPMGPPKDCGSEDELIVSPGGNGNKSSQHRRSVSFDLQQMALEENLAIARTGTTGALPLVVERQERRDPKPDPKLRFSTSIIGSITKRDSVPIHLCSATNEQKVSLIKQQIPFKLASNPGSNMSGSSSNIATGGTSLQHRSSLKLGPSGIFAAGTAPIIHGWKSASSSSASASSMPAPSSSILSKKLMQGSQRSGNNSPGASDGKVRSPPSSSDQEVIFF